MSIFAPKIHHKAVPVLLGEDLISTKFSVGIREGQFHLITSTELLVSNTLLSETVPFRTNLTISLLLKEITAEGRGLVCNEPENKLLSL